MSTHALHPTHVLILEDEALLRELMSEIVQSMGMTVTAFPTADEGLSYLEDHPEDMNLIITDVRMPGRLDGHQLAMIVHERWPSLPIVITSGYAAQSPALPENIVFLAKPWTIEQLNSTVREQLHAA